MDCVPLSALPDWIVAEGLKGVPDTALLAGICRSLVAAGVPLLRANIHVPTLHPIIGGHLIIWWRGDTVAVQESWDRSAGSVQAEQPLSPFEHMVATDQAIVRRRLDRDDKPPRFALFDRLRQRGGTDYLATQVRFGGDRALGPVDRTLFSWLTDLPEGFNDEHLAAFERITPPLALAVKAVSAFDVAQGVIETYLGRDAGQRVLSGHIERGMGETIRAVLWYCDLQGFTRLSDRVPRDQLLTMLDEYFECMVTTLHDFGAQVLKFTGDGLLAIFRLADDAESCRAALAAAERATRRVAELTAARQAAGQPVSEFYIALHLGDVMYGNIGARGRLDFTVVGPAVNEVSRIEAMCRALEQKLLVSSSFARAAAEASEDLVSLGRYVLRGVRRPQELFTLVPPEEPVDP